MSAKKKEPPLHRMRGPGHGRSLKTFGRPSNGRDREEGSYMTERRIYIGLNDADTKAQKFETEKYLGVLKNVCRSYRAAFSVGLEEGGYINEDGEYTEENSLVLVLIDTDRETVMNIAKDLCTFFHQESVLVTEDQVNVCFIQREEGCEIVPREKD